MCSILLEDSAGEDVADHANAWINPSQCIKLIDAISQACPTIEVLDIFAHEEDDEGDQTEYNIICAKVGELHSLRSLSFGGASAGETLFRSFARLPHLENLTLVSDRTQIMPYTESLVTLSDYSFPSLQHLTFCGVNPTIITRVCDVPWLFCRLASAKIIYEDLRVDLNPDLEYQDEDEFEEMLEEAGLERNDPPMTWEEFLAALPHLEELDIDNSFRVWDLVVFADWLPKLRYFAPYSIRASSESDTFGGATRPTATQPIVICCNYPQSTYFAPDPKEIPERARQIHEIWPNAEFEAREDAEWAQYMKSQLNKAIRALRLTG
ncbi:hypothetical protein FRC09_020410 [Ceratobasidium sp. 395]|nr:hypothetical protein FRC09_020410 [Ceratobasidium sp. 395]